MANDSCSTLVFHLLQIKWYIAQGHAGSPEQSVLD